MKYTYTYICSILLSCVYFSCSQKQETESTLGSFEGSWKLESWTAKLNDGTVVFPYGENAYGKLIYESTGEMSGILMAENRNLMSTQKPSERSPEESLEAFNTFFAYSGPYEVFSDSGFVMHIVEACSNPNWVGQVQKRYFKFENEKLTLSTPPIEVKGTKSQAVEQVLIWEKM